MLNTALIGTGYWGPNIAKSLELTEKARMTWLCDTNQALLDSVAKRYPKAKASTSLQQVLDDPNLDAVAIATPVATHHQLCKMALEAGKHVLVEKPVTLTSADALDLVKAAESANKTFMVGHVFQYNAGIRELKKYIKRGELGEILYMDFERTNLGPVRTEVNALWDLASHDVSIFCDLMDGPPHNVSALGSSFLNQGVEDVVFSTFGFSGGTLAHVHASWLNPRKIRRLVCVGTKKMAIWDDMDMAAPLTIVDKHVETPPPDQMGDTYLDFKTLCVDGDSFVPKFPQTPPLLAECEHFLHCVETGEPPRTGGMNGFEVVRVLEAATQSLKDKGVLQACDMSHD